MRLEDADETYITLGQAFNSRVSFMRCPAAKYIAPPARSLSIAARRSCAGRCPEEPHPLLAAGTTKRFLPRHSRPLPFLPLFGLRATLPAPRGHAHFGDVP